MQAKRCDWVCLLRLGIWSRKGPRGVFNKGLERQAKQTNLILGGRAQTTTPGSASAHAQLPRICARGAPSQTTVLQNFLISLVILFRLLREPLLVLLSFLLSFPEELPSYPSPAPRKKLSQSWSVPRLRTHGSQTYVTWGTSATGGSGGSEGKKGSEAPRQCVQILRILWSGSELKISALAGQFRSFL